MMSREELWRECFKEYYKERGFCLPMEECQFIEGVYVAARKKAQEEIEHLNIFIKEMKNTKATIALGEALKEIEKRDRLLDEAYRNISEQNPMSYEEEIEWIKQYKEMRISNNE